MNLEYKLIEEMKQEYHQKIRQLEKEREKILGSRKNDFNSKNNNEEKTKIVAL
jgi:hypothetical protein